MKLSPLLAVSWPLLTTLAFGCGTDAREDLEPAPTEVASSPSPAGSATPSPAASTPSPTASSPTPSPAAATPSPTASSPSPSPSPTPTPTPSPIAFVHPRGEIRVSPRSAQPSEATFAGAAPASARFAPVAVRDDSGHAPYGALSSVAASVTPSGSVLYRGLAPGVDLELTATAGGVRQELVLHAAPLTGNGALRFEEQVQLSGVSEITADGQTLPLPASGATSGELLLGAAFTVPPPELRDAGGRVVREGLTHRFDIDAAGNARFITEVPYAVLSDAELNWPVRVDPSLELGVELVEPECGVDDDCADAIDCTVERCEAGRCTVTISDARCDDANPCTLDGCDPQAGCTHFSDHGATPPDDGVACTEERCVDGVPEHRPVDASCAPPSAGCASARCDPAVGCVPVYDDSRCDDGDPCTAGVCDPDATDPSGCSTAPAREGLACVGAEGEGVCRAGVCEHALEGGCDADGDGHEALGCGGDDCDDADPLISPSIPESADNGVDDDCAAGDLVAATADGVFVDDRAPGGDEHGTREAPLRRLAEALAAADGRPIFVSWRGDPDDLIVTAAGPVTLYGGYDPATWTRGPEARSPLADVALSGDAAARILVDGFASLAAERFEVDRPEVVLRNLRFLGDLHSVRVEPSSSPVHLTLIACELSSSRGDELKLVTAGPELRLTLLSSRLTSTRGGAALSLNASGGAHASVHLVDSVLDVRDSDPSWGMLLSATAGASVRATLANVGIDAPPRVISARTDASGASVDVAVVHGTLRVTSAGLGPSGANLFVQGAGARVALTNTVVRAGNAGVERTDLLAISEGASARLDHVLLDLYTPGCLVQSEGVCVQAAQSVEACEWAGCLGASGVLTGSFGAFSLDERPPASCPCRGAGVDPGPWNEGNDPTALDAQGASRADGHRDLGRLEVVGVE